jgi:hypothetical protein
MEHIKTVLLITELLAVAYQVLMTVFVSISWRWGVWQRWQKLCVLSLFSYICSTTNANTQATVWPWQGASCTHTLAMGLKAIVPSNITDRPNHLLSNFISYPAFPAALSIWKTNRSPIFHFLNHCILNTSWYTHYAVTTITVHLCIFTLYIVFLDQRLWSRQRLQQMALYISSTGFRFTFV